MTDKLMQYSRTIAVGLLDAMHGRCKTLKEIAKEDSFLFSIGLGETKFLIIVRQGECEVKRYHYSTGKQRLETLDSCRNLSAEEALGFLLDFIDGK